MDKKTEKLIQKTAQDLFKLLTLDVKIKLEEDKDSIKVNIETENPGLLIGFHGETLSSLQLILALIAYKKTGKWTHLQVNIGDYRERREEQLREMVERIVDRVKVSGQPQALPYLPSNERRLVHLLIQDSQEVSSESEGKGPERRVVIKPKTSQ